MRGSSRQFTGASNELDLRWLRNLLDKCVSIVDYLIDMQIYVIRLTVVHANLSC